MAKERDIHAHMCPVCKSKLIQSDTTWALLEHATTDPLDKEATQVNLKRSFAVELYWCESCHRIELVSGG